MLQRKTMIVPYLLVFVAFTNLSTFTMNKFNIPLLPILFITATGILVFEILTSKSYLLNNYRNSWTYVINFFLLTFLTIGLINADMTKGIFPDIYLILTNLFVFHLILCYIQTEKELEGILLVIVLSGPVLFLNGAYEFVKDISTALLDYRIRAGSWWVNPNEYALVMNLIYLVSFYFIDKEKKVLRLIGYLAQLTTAAGIFLSLSRAGLIIFAIISLLGWRTFYRHKGYLVFLLILIPTVYLIVSINIFNIELIRDNHLDQVSSFYMERLNPWSELNREDYSNGRFDAAVTGLKIYASHPLIGAGLGNTIDYASLVSHTSLLSHNIFIEILATGGPLPLLGFMFMLGYLWFLFPGSTELKTDIGKVLRWFIIIFAVMGFFSHSLLYIKPVLVILSLLPIYFQFTLTKKYVNLNEQHCS